MLDQDLLAFLVALDTAAGNRVHLDIANASTPYPFIVVVRRGGTQPLVLSGRPLLPRSVFEVNTFALTHADAYPISSRIVTALHGFHGVIGTTRVHFTRCVQLPDHVSEQDGDRITRWVSSQFEFMHSEE